MRLEAHLSAGASVFGMALCNLLVLGALAAVANGQIVFGTAGRAGEGARARGRPCTSPEGLQGVCDRPEGCAALRSHIAQRDAAYIRRAFCARQNGVVLLCCAKSERNPVGSGSVNPAGSGSATEPPVRSGSENPFGSDSLNPSSANSGSVRPAGSGSVNPAGSPVCRRFRSPSGCGLSPFSPSRVVNGVPVRALGDFPWMAALRYRSQPVYKCGGAVISDRWVVTAAHCVMTDGPISVVVGDLNLSTDVDDSGTYPPQTIDVERRIRHPNFRRSVRGNSKGLFNDIALIKLRRPIQLSAVVKPLCIADPPSSVVELEGMQAFVAGWGATEFGGLTSPAMQWARIQVTSRRDCQRSYARRGNLVDVTQLCASGENDRGGVDTCHGDSGGPLMVRQIQNNRQTWCAAGIVSYGAGCGNTEIPGVYTHIGAFLDWIGCVVNGN